MTRQREHLCALSRASVRDGLYLAWTPSIIITAANFGVQQSVHEIAPVAGHDRGEYEHVYNPACSVSCQPIIRTSLEAIKRQSVCRQILVYVLLMYTSPWTLFTWMAAPSQTGTYILVLLSLSLSRSLTPSLTQSLTHSLTHLLTELALHFMRRLASWACLPASLEPSFLPALTSPPLHSCLHFTTC